MGGFGSNRWGTTVTRRSTDDVPQLDVRVLSREGTLQPGATSVV